MAASARNPKVAVNSDMFFELGRVNRRYLEVQRGRPVSV
jgi:hypothetical protein